MGELYVAKQVARGSEISVHEIHIASVVQTFPVNVDS